ncbi:MAG TPA: TonB-dependent receptor [Thermoanaerobaculia bacterium]|jgi:iron complex outermembrane receptor protein
MHSITRVVTTLLILISATALAQTSGTLSGKVTTSAAAPVAGAQVQIVDLRRTTTTDAGGTYRFDTVPAGRHLVQVESSRAGSSVRQVDTAGPSTTLDVTIDLAVHREEIVVSATGSPQVASEVAQPVDVVAGQDLQARRQPTLGETLAQEPGVSSTGFVPGASRPIIRGLGGDRIRILESGIGTGDASNVSQDHNVSVDPANAQSIEIIRGPATLLYGSNAIGGIVNVIDDRVPTASPGKAVSGSVDLRGSSNADERNGQLSLDGGTGMFAWHGNYDQRKTDDYDTPIGKLFNSDIDTKSGAVGASLVGNRGFLGLAYGGYDTNYGVSDAGPGVEPEEVVRIDMRNRRWDLRSELDGDVGPFSRYRFRFGRTDYNHSEIADGNTNITFLNKFNEGRVEASHRELGSLTGSIGVQYSRRDFHTEGEESLLPPTLTKNTSVFLFEEAGKGLWRVQFGGRYEHQDVSVTSDELLDRSFNGLSGSGALVYVPSADYSASLALSHAVRAPVAEELYFNGAHEATFQFEIGDPNLRKETANGLDLSLHKRTGTVTGTFSVYANRYDGYIFQNPRGDEEDGFPVFVFAQHNAEFYGAEGHADISLIHSDPNHLALELTGDYVHAELTGGGGPIPFIPPAHIGVGLRFQGASLYLLGEARHAAKQDRVAEFETPTAGYTLFNAAIGYRFFFGNTVSDVMLRGTNLTDKLARNHVNPLKDVVPLPGRDFSLSYRLTF